jgi:uncharacterized membrane protein YphA (DoxX/SURF4 family)
MKATSGRVDMKSDIGQRSGAARRESDDLPNMGRAGQLALAFLRVTVGVMFVWVFFENKGKGLYTPGGYAGLIGYYASAGHAPGFWKSIMYFAANHADIMGPIQAVTEISFGITLFIGLLTRPVALGAFFFLTSLWISEWGTAWIWELLVPMSVALGLAIASAGRSYGVDVFLAKKYPGLPIW